MRAKIFSFVRVSDSSMVASVRIARFLSSELGVQIADDDSVSSEPLDALLIVNGAFAFCKHLEALGEAIREAGRLVWIGNDYTVIIPKEESGAESPFRKAFRDRKQAGRSRADMWTTVKADSRATPNSCLINWNCLTLDDADPATVLRRRGLADDSLLYYGSFRSGRRDAFDRYFREPRVQTTISSPSRKFMETYTSREIVHLPKIEGDLYEAIGIHGLGLCIEDRKSHSEWHSTPNRFYEMLSAGLPMVFQPEMGTSLRRGGYDPEPWVVRNSLEIERLMPRKEEIGAAQRVLWLPRARGEREDMISRLHAAWAMQTDRLS